jgi:hypothetical protein
MRLSFDVTLDSCFWIDCREYYILYIVRHVSDCEISSSSTRQQLAQGFHLLLDFDLGIQLVWSGQDLLPSRSLCHVLVEAYLGRKNSQEILDFRAQDG